MYPLLRAARALLSTSLLGSHSARHDPICKLAFTQSRPTSTEIIRSPLRRRELLTLDPAHFESLGQQVLDMSNVTKARVHISSWRRKPWFIHYLEGGIRFPPHAQGLLYYHPGEIRFRLCHSVDEFDHGSDLELPNGKTWRVTLRHALKNFSDPERSGIIGLIPDHSLSLSNWHVNPAQRVVTLSPKEINKQQIIDWSGTKWPCVYTGASGGYSRLSYFYRKASNDHISFPDGCRGVLYYKQSKTAPTQVGELRFRLCNSVQSFEEGTDLLLPSGDIWHIRSNQILLVAEHRNLRNFLAEEGLLDCRLYPNELIKSATTAPQVSPHLLHSSQPFVLNLAQKTHALCLWTGSSFEPSNRFHVCPKNRKPPYKGRALVRLEPAPQSLLDLQPTGKASIMDPPPLFVLRILEMITPLERNPAWTDNDTEHALLPTPGELYMRHYRNKFVPWLIRIHRQGRRGFSPEPPEAAN